MTASLDDFYADANKVAPVTLRRFQVSWNNIPGQEKPLQPLEVTYPVVVAVLEQADVDGVDDTGPVPAGQHLNLPRL